MLFVPMSESRPSGTSRPFWRSRELQGLVLCWLLVSVPAFWVYPALDNWSSSRPMAQFSWDILLPRLFWRPLEMSNLALVSVFPALYPWYLHLLAVVGHGLSGVVVRYLARRAGAEPRSAAWATALFLVSPAVGAAVWNIHGVTQTWSTALGLLSVWAYVTFVGGRAGAVWVGFAALSALWKESGLAFFLAAPILAELLRLTVPQREAEPEPHMSRLTSGLLKGLAGIAIYMLLRRALAPGASLGLPRGPYALHVDPLLWGRNLVMLLGVSLTTVDTIALFGFPRRPLWALVSVIAGLPLAAVLGLSLRRTWSLERWRLAVLSVLAVSGVYLPMGHVSEKYAHSIVAVLAILLAVGALRIPRSSSIPALALFLLAAAAVDAHKLTEMILTGRGAEEVAGRIASQTSTPPVNVCIVAVGQEKAQVYAVFQGNPGPASGWGIAVLPHWNWQFPKSAVLVAQRERCSPDRDTLWTVSVDGRVVVERLR